jgi:hypothetical protein
MAGYIDENGVRQQSMIGTPQGSILSPLLANIVLNKLDQFMASHQGTLNFGTKRKVNAKYQALENRRKYYKLRNPDIARQALLDMRKLSKFDMFDGTYGRSLYLRYADDFVVLMANTLKEATEFKALITKFLKDECGLDLNQEKTTITNTRDGFKFLGAWVQRRKNVSLYNTYKKGHRTITRRTTPRMAVDAPIALILDKLVSNGFARRNHEGRLLAKGLTSMIHLSHFDIIRYFNSKITGLLSAYSFAGNFASMNKVC